ncbi:unnamed protein product [Polarella glacialis]|uniref:SET domain-containing protein n=1 Tax=Polarella glacialis TaxID=89957 RepID=A0A813GWX5_POLGL|nr:unnamed protein product [Polarella glacialis]
MGMVQPFHGARLSVAAALLVAVSHFGSSGVLAAAPESGCKASASSGPSSTCLESRRSTHPQRTFRELRRLLAGAGGLLRRDLLELREGAGGQLGFFARTQISAGEVLLEVPLHAALWRGSVDLGALGIHLAPGAQLSEAERLILGLAVLRRAASSSQLELGESVQAHLAYAHLLVQEPVPNSTALWGIDELRWLQGTDAGELTSHFLSRIAQVHAAAPEAAELIEVKAAFAQYYSRHVQLWLDSSGFMQEQLEGILLPGIDFCRHQEGSSKPVFLPERRVVRLSSSLPLAAGEQIFVDFGVRDHTDLMVGQGVLGGPLSGVFLPVPLGHDANGGAKSRLLEQLNWPAEVRLVGEEIRDVRSLRLAAMPPEEFSSWSVGALVSGTPLAVSRAFRTEVQANAYLLQECTRRGANARQQPSVVGSVAASRVDVAQRYREHLSDAGSSCVWPLPAASKGQAQEVEMVGLEAAALGLGLCGGGIVARRVSSAKPFGHELGTRGAHSTTASL